MPFGQGHIGGFPASGLSWIIVALIVAYVLTRTVFGRWVYAGGANPVAVELMGVPMQPVLLGAYTLSSLMAALGGLLITAYIGNPSLGIGDQFLLTSAAAAVVGGTALTGGIGSIISTVGGALLIMEANSFTNIAHMSTGTQYIAQGVVGERNRWASKRLIRTALGYFPTSNSLAEFFAARGIAARRFKTANHRASIRRRRQSQAAQSSRSTSTRLEFIGRQRDPATGRAAPILA